MKYLLALMGCVWVNLSNGQNVGIGTSSPTARLHVTDSNVVFSADGPPPAPAGNLSFPNTGRGLIWYADKAAFRAGMAMFGFWHKDSIGLYSFAGGVGNLTKGQSATSFGSNNTSSGISSFAAGGGNYATDSYSSVFGQFSSSRGYGSFAAGVSAQSTAYASTAFGNETFATGEYSTAFGQFSQASGIGSLAAGQYSVANNLFSVAMGYNSIANGIYSLSFGDRSVSNGFASFAAGTEAKARAFGSVALGYQTIANGSASTAIGFATQANSESSLALGILNDTLVATGAVSGDRPLLMVGNGRFNFDLSVSRSNAFTVFNSGNAVHQGYTKLGNSPGDNAPSIKMKEIAGANTSLTDGGTVTIPHGLDRSKIIGFSAIVNYGAGDVIPGFRATPGFEFSIAYDNVNIYIYNIAGNSANITGKPVKMVITYKE